MDIEQSTKSALPPNSPVRFTWFAPPAVDLHRTTAVRSMARSRRSASHTWPQAAISLRCRRHVHRPCLVHAYGRTALLQGSITPSRPGQSILEGVDELFGALTPDSATWQSVHHTHSSTVATNALIERRGARIGLITTAGFRDVFELQRLAIPHPMRFDSRRPGPLVPRALVREVRGRIGPGRRRTRTARRGGCGRGGARVAGRGRGHRGGRPDPQLSQSGARAAGARHRRRGTGLRSAPGAFQRDLAAGARTWQPSVRTALERVDPSDRGGLSRSPDRWGWRSACSRSAAARGAIERRRRATGGDVAANALSWALLSGAAAGVAGAAAEERCRLDGGRSDDARRRRHQCRSA